MSEIVALWGCGLQKSGCGGRNSLQSNSLFSAPEKIEMILLRGFLSSGTEGRGFELWLAKRESLPEPVLKMVLLILTGGAGGLSSGSPLSHISTGCWGRGGGGSSVG